MRRLSEHDVKSITELYSIGNSIKSIAQIYGVTYAPMQRFFKKHGIKRRTLSEAQQISTKSMLGLKKWQETHGSWYRGLDKNDPRVAAVIEKGRATQIRNGKNKGAKNPMYGRTTHGAIGYRKDLGQFFRSSWEANFARMLVALGLDYVYEPHAYELDDGTTYTPDFFVPVKNKYYEIKGFERNNKFVQFRKKFPEIRIKMVKEDFYARLLCRLSSRITVEDAKSFYTKNEIIDLFVQYLHKMDKRPSVSKFCREIGVSTKTIKYIFGSVKNLSEVAAEEIRSETTERLRVRWMEWISLNGRQPTYKEMQRHYRRTASVLNNYFYGKYQMFTEWASTNIFPKQHRTKF